VESFCRSPRKCLNLILGGQHSPVYSISGNLCFGNLPFKGGNPLTKRNDVFFELFYRVDSSSISFGIAILLFFQLRNLAPYIFRIF
jgi:hypothetical protein